MSSLVTRQLTLEERDALLPDPTAWQPADVGEGELTAVPDVVAVRRAGQGGGCVYVGVGVWVLGCGWVGVGVGVTFMTF